MRDLGDYFKALFGKTREMLTGGLIALYLVIQPFTSLPSTPRRFFWAILIIAVVVAGFRAWRDERRGKSQLAAELFDLHQREQNTEVLREEPRVMLFVRWPENDPSRGPLSLFARNRGRFRLRSFLLNSLHIGLHSVSFVEVPELLPDVDYQITYQIPGAQDEAIDLLDLLMINKPTEISPVRYQLRGEVQKENGQRRSLGYSLIYAPLHNPRRVNRASEFSSMIVIEQV